MLQKKILLLLLSLLSHMASSQALQEPSYYNIPRPFDSGEDLILESDRQFYCVDEKIYFTTAYHFEHPVENLHWSNVVYVELIRWNGEKIAQAKFKLHEKKASGYLTIPKTLLSGSYYLRAYTKWMRNYPPEDYAYKLVKVINPFESIIDQGPIQEPAKKIMYSKQARGNPYREIECSTGKATFKQREKVDLILQLKNHDHDGSIFCVSVAKAASIDTNQYVTLIPDKIANEEESLSYLPEFRGISISGKILNASTPVSLANATVHLSTPQNWKYFSNFNTRAHGSFYFTLPDIYGYYDFYIDAVLENGERADILLDNDYCNRSIQLAYIPFSLDSIEREIASEMIVNMQLSNIYHEKSIVHTPGSAQIPFYGSPKHVYFTEKYIQLPNLEEFFYELVKEVRTIRIKKQSYLKLVAFSEYVDLNPLILLDNIPVSDVDEFLRIPLDRIEKVEIFDEPYIVSGKKYSGIICVSTKNKDFAGIKLIGNSMFFSYSLLSEGNFDIPDYGPGNSNRLIYRDNLLFWDPDLELSLNQPQTLSFYTSDSKGEYIVYIRSLSTDGEPRIYGTCKIVVE